MIEETAKFIHTPKEKMQVYCPLCKIWLIVKKPKSIPQNYPISHLTKHKNHYFISYLDKEFHIRGTELINSVSYKN